MCCPCNIPLWVVSGINSANPWLHPLFEANGKIVFFLLEMVFLPRKNYVLGKSVSFEVIIPPRKATKKIFSEHTVFSNAQMYLEIDILFGGSGNMFGVVYSLAGAVAPGNRAPRNFHEQTGRFGSCYDSYQRPLHLPCNRNPSREVRSVSCARNSTSDVTYNSYAEDSNLLHCKQNNKAFFCAMQLL